MALDAQGVYEFTTDWFSGNIDTWRGIFVNTRVSPRRVLEIGSYLGRSSIWIIENFLNQPGTSLVAIDTWAEGVESDQRGMNAVENSFDRNMSTARQRHPEIQIEKCKGVSLLILSRLIATGSRGAFDFVYIDGSHQASDVLTDLVLSFQLCRVGGLIFCDDCLWEMHRVVTETPKLAIDSFLACYRYKVRINPERCYQIYL